MIKYTALQTFPTDIVYIIGKKKFKKYFKKLGIDNTIEKGAVCSSLYVEGFHTIVIGSKKPKNAISAKALWVHELSHAVTCILEAHGIDDDETRSYLLQFLYSDSIPMIDKYYKDKYE